MKATAACGLAALALSACETHPIEIDERYFVDRAKPATTSEFSDEIARKIAVMGLGESLPQIEIAPGNSPEAKVFLQEFDNHLLIRTHTEPREYVGVRVDVNNNGRYDDAADSSFGDDAHGPCHPYGRDRWRNFVCGDEPTDALFFRERTSRKVEIIRVIPKRELSANGDTASIKFEVIDTFVWLERNPIRIVYRYQLPR